MDIFSVLVIMCVSVAGSAFLGHAIGYRRAELLAKRRALIELKRSTRLKQMAFDTGRSIGRREGKNHA